MIVQVSSPTTGEESRSFQQAQEAISVSAMFGLVQRQPGLELASDRTAVEGVVTSAPVIGLGCDPCLLAAGVD